MSVDVVVKDSFNHIETKNLQNKVLMSVSPLQFFAKKRQYFAKKQFGLASET